MGVFFIQSYSGCNLSLAQNKSSEANIIQMLASDTQLQSEKNVFIQSDKNRLLGTARFSFHLHVLQEMLCFLSAA